MDEEEARVVRLYAAGKFTESLWDSLWQDHRTKIRATVESLEHEQQTHITNLDAVLQMIAQVGIVYNSLECGDSDGTAASHGFTGRD